MVEKKETEHTETERAREKEWGRRQREKGTDQPTNRPYRQKHKRGAQTQLETCQLQVTHYNKQDKVCLKSRENKGW